MLVLEKLKHTKEANFATISGQVAKQQSRLAQIQTASQVGATLLTMNTPT
jgi:hypothetical protein